MINKRFIHNGVNIRINNINHQESDIYEIITDKKAFLASEEELVKDFHPLDEKGEANLELYRGIQFNVSTLDDLSTTLMDNIKKVQEDPKHIDQARATNEIAKAVIDIKKVQIEAIRLMKDI